MEMGGGKGLEKKRDRRMFERERRGRRTFSKSRLFGSQSVLDSQLVLKWSSISSWACAT